MSISIRYVDGMMAGRTEPCPPQMLLNGQLLSFRWIRCGDETYRVVSFVDDVLTAELVRNADE